MVSAETPLGMASQPLTTAPPWRQMVRILFSLMNVYFLLIVVWLQVMGAMTKH